MGFDIENLTQWLYPAAFVVVGIIAGTIFDKLIMASLKKATAKAKRPNAEQLLESIPQGVVIFWFLLAGIYAALLRLPITLYEEHVRIINSSFLIISLVLLTWAVASLVGGAMYMVTKKTKGMLPTSSILISLAKLAVIIIGVLTILNSLGISVTPILTALGVGGLAVALALQDTLSNMFAGLQIILSKQLQPGNYIKMDSGEEGYVTDINWRNTTVKELPNNMIVIPNAKIAKAIVKNYYMPEKEMAVLIKVGVSYGSDLKKVEKVTIEVGQEVMKEVAGGIPEFTPFIRYHTFNDFSIDFTVILRAKEFVEKYLIKHEFIKRLHERYQKEGIEIPFPIRTIYNKTAVLK